MTEPLEGNSSSDAGSSPVVTTDSGNPAWDGVLSELPAGIAPILKPHFEKWDKNYQDLSQKYAPFKDYTPEKVKEFESIYKQIDADPVAFYNRLGEQLKRLGLTPAEVKEAVQEAKKEESVDDNVDPEVAALKAELDAMKKQFGGTSEWIQKQEYEQQVRSFEAQITEELNGLRKTHGVFDETEVFRRAAANEALGKGASITQAFNEMLEYENKIRSTPTRSTQTPFVANPAGGGIPNTAGLEKPKTKEERQEYFAAKMRALGSG